MEKCQKWYCKIGHNNPYSAILEIITLIIFLSVILYIAFEVRTSFDEGYEVGRNLCAIIPDLNFTFL